MKKLKKQIIFLISLVCLATLQVSMTSAYLRFSTPNILHDFEGFYRFPNRVAYIQFEVIDKQLTAKQVWDGRQYPLTQTGDLTFESNEERYKVAFDAIQPTAVEILNRVTLTKIDFDPTKRQTLSPALAKLYVGSYRLQRDSTHIIDIVVEGEDLVLVQTWDGKRIPLESITDQEFINQENAMPVSFERQEANLQIRCFEDDIWVKEKR